MCCGHRGTCPGIPQQETLSMNNVYFVSVPLLVVFVFLLTVPLKIFHSFFSDSFMTRFLTSCGPDISTFGVSFSLSLLKGFPCSRSFVLEKRFRTPFHVWFLQLSVGIALNLQSTFDQKFQSGQHFFLSIISVSFLLIESLLQSPVPALPFLS